MCLNLYEVSHRGVNGWMSVNDCHSLAPTLPYIGLFKMVSKMQYSSKPHTYSSLILKLPTTASILGQCCWTLWNHVTTLDLNITFLLITYTGGWWMKRGYIQLFETWYGILGQRLEMAGGLHGRSPITIAHPKISPSHSVISLTA